MSKMNGIHGSPTAARLLAVRQMLSLYTIVLLLIIIVALLNCKYPELGKRLLRDEVGLVAFVCFVSIQAAFELETERTVAQGPLGFYVKVAVYIVDLCVMVNARVRPSLVIPASTLAVEELWRLYRDVRDKYAGITPKTIPDDGDGAGKYRSVGTFMVLINIAALALTMGRDTLFPHVSAETIKSLLAGGLVAFYIDFALRKRVEEFMESGSPRGQNLVYGAFSMVRPVISAALAKLKKMKKVKFS